MVLGVAQDRALVVVAKPLLRWAREVWIRHVGGESAGSKDAIKFGEVWQVWDKLNQAEEQLSLVVQGLIRQLQDAPRYLGWKYEEPLALRDEHGVDCHINEVTPAMLWKVAVRSRRRAMEAALNDKSVR